MATKKAEEKSGAIVKPTATAAKPAKEKKERAIGVRNFKDDAVITLLVSYNPKRAGSKAHASFECYEDEMTVKQFLAAGGLPVSLGWDTAHGFIKIGETFDEDAEKKSKPEPKPKAEKNPTAGKAGKKAVAEKDADEDTEDPEID